MFLEELRKKRDYLLAIAADADLTLIAHEIKRVADSLPHTPNGVRSAAIEALVYASVRHRHFSTTEILTEILVSYLSHHFGIARAYATALTNAALSAIQKSASKIPSHIPDTNREFLKYLFVHVACARSEEDLTSDLGLGTEILSRLKQSIDIVAAIQDAEADAPLMFLPEMDAQVADIMNEMTRGTKADPWALEHLRLSYQILGIGEKWSRAITAHGITGLFQVLLAIGSGQSASTKKICDCLVKIYPEIDRNPAMLEFLIEFNLAFPEGESPQEKTRWSLTGFANSLTQDAFAKRFLAQERNPSECLGSLSPAYQAAVIKWLPMHDHQTFVDIAKMTRPLVPPALTAIFDRLSAANLMTLHSDTALFVLCNDPSPWLRKAACRSLATTPRSDAIDQVFAEVARSDRSSSVRAEARAILGQQIVEDSGGFNGSLVSESQSIAAQRD